jgi:hypothetical protein
MSLTNRPLDVVSGSDRPARETGAEDAVETQNPIPSPLTPERATERLACILYETESKLDPTGDDPPWTALTEYERDFYRCCIRKLMTRSDLVAPAASAPAIALPRRYKREWSEIGRQIAGCVQE